MALAGPVCAQDTPTPPEQPRDGGDIIAPGDIIDFEADELRYDETGDIVTASG
ncbi:MAG: hypothetical protein RL490_634, partial [Pseudomonadota bacterium]